MKQIKLFLEDYYCRQGKYNEWYKEECGLCEVPLKDKICLVMIDDEYGECADPVFCSLNCYTLWNKLVEQMNKQECKLCGCENNLIFHHINYKENRGVYVCEGCHKKIHSGKPLFDCYKPIDERKYTNRWNHVVEG